MSKTLIKPEDIYGQWKVLCREYHDNKNMWKCECVGCGNINYFNTTRLTHKPPRCMKCTRHPKFKDLTGKVFGELTVICEDTERENTSDTYWVCQCSCGNKTSVYGSDLTRGNTKSCGRKICSAFKSRKERKSHKKGGTKLYTVWTGIKQRCLNPNSDNYIRYGGRGITICDEWKNDFLCFEKWAIENGYNENLTIDRIDVNGNYCPENCRWITHKEQSNNLRTNHIETYEGVMKTIPQWSELLKVSEYTIRDWARRKTKTFQDCVKEFLLKNGYNSLEEYIGEDSLKKYLEEN